MWVWDVSTGAELEVIEGHMRTIWSIAFSNDGGHIISGSEDNFVWVWDALTGTELKVCEGHTDSVSSVAFSIDGTQIVPGSKDNSVHVWDASTGTELKVLDSHMCITVLSVLWPSSLMAPTLSLAQKTILCMCGMHSLGLS